MEKLHGLILAAGKSSRLGQPKQLLPWYDTTLLSRQINLLKSILVEASCVLGAFYQDIEHECVISGAKVIHNPNWEEGQGGSIATGVCSLEEDIDAVLILLVDQWALNNDDIEHLINQWRLNTDKIVVSAINNSSQLSPPVIFPRQYFDQLMALSGEAGAKKVIQNNHQNVVKIRLPNASIDLDTKQDLTPFYEHQANNLD